MRHMLTGDEWGAPETYRLGLVQGPPGVRLDVCLGEPGIYRKQLAPTRALALGPSLHPAQKSPSVTIPTSCPFRSRTGTPLMRRLIRSLATFRLSFPESWSP